MLQKQSMVRRQLELAVTHSASAAKTNRLQVQSHISMAVSPPLADLGEFEVTAFRMLIIARKLITKSPVLAGITSSGGMRNEQQLT